MLTIKQEHMSYETTLKLINLDRNVSGVCKVEFADGSVTMPVRPMMLQLPIWEIYRKLGKPVKQKQLFFTGPPFNEEVYSKVLHQVYTECFEAEFGEEYFSDLKDGLWYTINNLDDFGNHELGEYVCGLSILDLATIRQHPKIKEIADVDIREELGVMHIKSVLAKGEKDLYRALGTENFIEDNALYPFISVKALKSSQLFQVMATYGLRTEINDRVIKRPVYGSSLEGLQDVYDFVLENLSARKNVYYAHDAIRLSQYFNREMSLICSVLEHLYAGNCNHEVLLPFVFDETYIDKCYGKYFILPDDPERKVRVLMEYNASEYVNKEVEMYSILTCGHTNGICEHCMGLLARNYTKGINIGITSSSNLISVISQLILSTKHVDSAVPTVYQVPEPANEWFHVGKNGIKFTTFGAKLMDRMELGFFFHEINCTTGDLQHIHEKMDVPENKYSEIHSILLKDTKTNVIIEVQMDKDGMVPYLTTDFLVYMKNHMQNGIKLDKEVIWVPLTDMIKSPIPIMRSTVYNNSMMVFVNHVVNIFKRDHLSKYKNASKALIDLSKIIFDKVTDVNLVQLEVLIRAHMVTSPTNMSIPIVTDVDNVYFRKTKQVIANRTISGQLVHEGHNAHFADAFTFTTLKDQSVLDPFFKI